MLVKFEIPSIAPDVVIQVSNLTKEADVKFKDGDERHKKRWVKEQAMPLLDGVKLKEGAFLVGRSHQGGRSVHHGGYDLGYAARRAVRGSGREGTGGVHLYRALDVLSGHGCLAVDVVGSR